MRTSTCPSSYDVAVTVKLAEGCTAEDADMNPADVRTHTFRVNAPDAEQAGEAALDLFHSSIPIGVLDAVEITTEATLRT